MSRVLADASALVALWSPGDRHHRWAKEVFSRLRPPLFTCEAALTESAYLLRAFPNRRGALLAAWRQGVLKIDFTAQAEREAVVELMQSYANVPMSFADACLVRMSETEADAVVWTTDTDFLIYRRHRRQTIPVLMPEL